MNSKIFLLFLTFLIISCNKNSIVRKKYLNHKELVAAYSFSGNANDLSHNNHNGIIKSAKLTKDRKGKSNSAYYFNGDANFILLEKNDDFILTDKGCVMAWVKPENIEDNIALLSNGTSIHPQYNCYNLVLNDYGHQWEILAYIGGNQINRRPEPILHDYNKWYFIVYQWEKNGNVSLFTNGVLEYAQKNTALPKQENNTDLRIGHLAHNSYFKGVIDELIISKNIYSESEIREIYISTK